MTILDAEKCYVISFFQMLDLKADVSLRKYDFFFLQISKWTRARIWTPSTGSYTTDQIRCIADIKKMAQPLLSAASIINS